MPVRTKQSAYHPYSGTLPRRTVLWLVCAVHHCTPIPQLLTRYLRALPAEEPIFGTVDSKTDLSLHPAVYRHMLPEVVYTLP